MKRSLLLFLLMFSFTQLKSEDTIQIFGLHFTSDFEKKHLEEFQKTKNPDILALLLGISETTTDFDLKNTQDFIGGLFTDMDNKLKRENDLSKKVKYIFTSVQDKCFKKYELGANFDQVSKKGIYNCVSGTALYSLILDHYKIKYKIIEKPKHVYLIADPENKKIIVESTNPAEGSYTLTDKFKKSYVDYLLGAKLITKEELNSTGYDAIFDKNYYSDESITLQQLAGLQYYNSCIDYLSKSDFLNAFYQIEKAYLLYPSKRTKYLLLACAEASLGGKDYSKTEDIDMFIKAFNYAKPEDISPFVSTFESITARFLIDKNKKEYYDQVFSKLSDGIKDSTFSYKTKLLYNMETGRAYYLEGKYDKALEYTLVAYSMNPDNLEIRSRFSGLIMGQLKNINDFEKIVAHLDSYIEKYAFLKENTFINQAYGHCYLAMSSSHFEANNEKLGNKYLKQFEEIAKNKDYSMDEQMIGIAYCQAWAYYVRKSQRPVAKQYIIRGIKYAPYNTDLQHKKRITEEDGN